MLAAILLTAEAVSRSNYLLFHSLVEGAAVALGVALFMLGWSLRGQSRDGFVTTVGVAYLSAGSLEALHLLAYPGMGVFASDTNLAAQLWIGARTVEVLGLIIAVSPLGRRLPPLVALVGGAGVTLAIGLPIAVGAFPTCFVPGQGLTAFKIGAEYALCGALAGAALWLSRDRLRFDTHVRRLMIGAMLATVASELAFTLYTDAFGMWNKVGHHLLAVSIFLVYLGVLREGVTRPMATTYRALELSRQDLELQVADRTRDLRELTEELRQEIAERRQAEAALRASEQEIRSIIERLPQAIAVHQGGRFVLANPKVGELLRIPTDDLLGTPIIDVVHPDDRAAVRARVAEMARTGAPPPVVEERFVAADGSTVLGEVVAIPLTFDGAPAVLVAVRDITRERAVQAQSMDMDRVITMGRLAAAVGHEINNPLTAVTSNVDWLRQRPGADTEAARVLADVADAAERIRATVAALRQLSAPIDETPARASLTPMIEGALALAGNELRHHATVDLDLRAHGLVEAPAGRLGQVFLNLLLNAAEAIERAGPGPHNVRVRTADEGDRVVAEVCDTGPGLPDDDADRIFEPFYTTRATRLGSGLGLSICRDIVEANGGHITARTLPEGGACFRVELPACDAPAPPAPAPAAPPPPATSTGAGLPRVLVIDDEVLVGRVVTRMLRGQADVEVCRDPHAGLARLLDGDTFDLVLCDLMMPGLTGVELHRRLVDDAPDIAASMVFITGGAFTEDAAAFAAEHADRVIHKPFRAEQLTALLHPASG